MSGPQRAPEENEQHEFLLRLADVSPKHAIIETWRLVEESAANALTRAGKEKEYGINYAEKTFCPDILSPEDARTYQKLRMARNVVAGKEDFEFKRDTPQKFIKIAMRLIDNFEAYHP